MFGIFRRSNRPSLHSTVNTVVAGMLISACGSLSPLVRVAHGTPLNDAENHMDGIWYFRWSRTPGLYKQLTLLRVVFDLLCRLILSISRYLVLSYVVIIHEKAPGTNTRG